MSEYNPYAAPESAAEPLSFNRDGVAGTCWRDGDELLALPGTDLPRCCVKCGEPASEYRKRTFYWHSAWLYLLILLHMLVYLIVALIVRKSASHQIGLCVAHQRQRRLFIALAWLSVVPLVGCFLFDSGVAILVGVLAFVVMLFCGLFGMRLLKPTQITPELAVYKGVSPRLLAQLPRYPYPRTPA